MKKIKSKITHNQWMRISVPNTAQVRKIHSSGEYDLEEAQKQYDRCSLPNYVYDFDSDDTGEENSDEKCTENGKADVKSACHEVPEYDVPRISFHFFESKPEKACETKKSEIKIVLATPPTLVRCESDSNLRQNDDEDDESFYKVPKKVHRLSRSLHDFQMEEHNEPEPVELKETTISSRAALPTPDSENLDYCTVRSKLPLKIRRPTFLIKPRKAVDTWNHFRHKFSTMMTEQAAQQRVGAYEEKDKVTLNLDDMRTKCRNALINTKKRIFRKNQEHQESQESFESDTTASGQMVKNDAFFAKITAKDIEYKFDYGQNGTCEGAKEETVPGEEFNTIKSTTTTFRRSKCVAEGQNGFEDLRRYVKQGGDFCKELATILQERADAETQYAKSLSKLSCKLSKACREGVGGLNEAWKAVSLELETRAEAHRILGQQILEETAKPLKNLTDSQHRTRKQCESVVDKTAKSLAEWRSAEAKGKKQSHTCARDNEKLQDAAILDCNKTNKLTLSRSSSLIQIAQNNKNSAEKESAKLEIKKKKAEDAVKKADIEYYTLCVRAERARLEWESAVLRGVHNFQSLEEERLNNLKSVLNSYLQHSNEMGPKLISAVERLQTPVVQSEPSKDLSTLLSLRQSSQQISEQLLPDFYCEHITLAMNRERRKQALVKLLHLIRQDIERERKSKSGLENLSKALKDTPNFGAEDSQQSVCEKLFHMQSMLTYLEGARYKVHNALAELDSKPKSGHPLAPHITITRDKSGLQQSILKVPPWLKENWFEPTGTSPLSEKSIKSSDNNSDVIDWPDARGAADGNSNQPNDSDDFDEFSSQASGSSSIAGNNITCTNADLQQDCVKPIAQCKALYAYTPNLTDELALRPGDLLAVYRQQDDGWWLGECRGNVGIFPATYVEVITSN